MAHAALTVSLPVAVATPPQIVSEAGRQGLHVVAVLQDLSQARSGEDRQSNHHPRSAAVDVIACDGAGPNTDAAFLINHSQPRP